MHEGKLKVINGKCIGQFLLDLVFILAGEQKIKDFVKCRVRNYPFKCRIDLVVKIGPDILKIIFPDHF